MNKYLATDILCSIRFQRHMNAEWEMPDPEWFADLERLAKAAGAETKIKNRHLYTIDSLSIFYRDRARHFNLPGDNQL